MCHNKPRIRKVPSEAVSPRHLTCHINVGINYVLQRQSKAVEGVNKKRPSEMSCNICHIHHRMTPLKKVIDFSGVMWQVQRR